MRTERDRDRVCDAFINWIHRRIDTWDPDVMRVLWYLVDRVADGGCIDLGCHCAPRRCHCDTIRAIVLDMYQYQLTMKRIQQSRHSGYNVGMAGDARFHPVHIVLPDGQLMQEACMQAMSHIPKGSIELRYQALYQCWAQWAVENPALVQELLDRAIENNYCLCDPDSVGVIHHTRALSQILTELLRNDPLRQHPALATSVPNT